MAAFWYGRAVGSFNRGRFDAALRYMLKAAEYNPATTNDAVACSVIGRSHLAMNRPDQAITFLEKAYDLYSGSQVQDEVLHREYVATLKALSDALRTLGQERRAEQMAQEAVRVARAGPVRGVGP